MPDDDSIPLSRNCEQFTAKLLASVSDPGCALKLTVFALTATAALYLLLHLLISNQPVDFSKAVSVSPDARFQCYYRDDLLDRFFARNSVNEWKQRMDEKGLVLRAEALDAREQLLLPLQQFVKNSLADQAVLVSSWATGTNAGNNLLSVNLPQVMAWLEKQRDAVQPAKRGVVDEFILQLQDQNRHEAMLRCQLVAEITGLKSNLSFDWLFVDSWKWVIEVFFWCTFGVWANTFIALITATREGRYDPKEFLLVWPKAMLAPVIALVIIAWWTTGFSESKISFLNLPYFLVLSFSLGFVTESLYVKIKELGNLIVGPSATDFKAKLEQAAKQEVYHFVQPNVAPSELPPASNLEMLREQLRAAAKAAVERGLVTQLASSQKPKS